MTTLATVLVVLGILDGPVRYVLTASRLSASNEWVVELIVRISLGEVAVTITVIALMTDRRTARRRRADILRESNIAGRVAADSVFLRTPTVREIFDLSVTTHARYYDETIGLFSSMLVDPKYRTRILERVVLKKGYAVKLTRIEYLISAEEKDGLLARAAGRVPNRAAAPPKGRGSETPTAEEDRLVSAEGKEGLLVRVAGRLPSRSAETPKGREPDTHSEERSRSASGDASLGDASPVVLVVPLIPVRKGSLLSGLQVTDHRGSKLSILTQAQTLGLVSIALASYFSLAFRGVGLARENVERPGVLFTPDADARLWALRQIALYPGIVSRERAEAAFDRVVGPLNKVDEESYDRLRNLCLFFADNQFLACEVAMPDGFFVSVQMEVDASVVDHRNSREQELRDFFGLEPYQYLIDLDIAHLTDNYHAELDGQDRNQYVYRQQVVDDTTGVVVDDEYFKNPERTGQVIYQSEPTRVSPRVNVRNFSDPARPRLIWNVAVEEVPPGGLAPVLSLAVVATVVAFCFAFIVPKLSSDNFDAPALVVALPLFIVTFFGFSFDKMSRSSLPAVVAFVVTSVFVVISAILVLVSSDQPVGVIRSPSLFGFWRLYDFSWPLLVVSLLLLIVSLNLSFLGYRRVKRFRLLSQRDDQLSRPHVAAGAGRGERL